MGFAGLREFIDLLDREGELARVRVPVDLDQELGAVCVTSLRGRGPALLFERPGGKDIPIFINALASRKRYALAMQCEQQEIHREWNRRVQSAGAAGARRTAVLARRLFSKEMTSTSWSFPPLGSTVSTAARF